ncbi:MAG: dihydroorotase [Acidimicrobiia bacterium]|nr:dihydroorotase [Acidimicrobiia bacterium]
MGKDGFLIKNATIVDSRGTTSGDVLIDDGRITDVGKIEQSGGEYLIDAHGLILSPGIVDIQVHLREPGFEESEEIETGARASAVGGMTAVQCMPNTNPCIDNVNTFRDVKHRSQNAMVDVFVSAAITKNRASEENVDFKSLYEAGARTFTDDGDCVKTARLMRETIETLSQFDDCVLAQHCEDHSLVHDGIIDEGEISKQLGLKGRHRVGEEIIVARDIALMRAFASPKLRYHVLHISTKEALTQVRDAIAQGLNVSSEVTPQHIALASDLLLSGNANFKMNPPLRTFDDINALRLGLKNGTIAAIATDHAPHPKSKKDLGIEHAPPGMLGVQTVLAASITHLVETGVLTIEELINVLCINPAKIINAHKLENGGHGCDITVGNKANIMIFDPQGEFVVNKKDLLSKSENSPWEGHTLKGVVHYTFKSGEMTCEKGQPTK